MRRKIIAWTATMLIIALVSVAFLIPADPNPDFGMVEDIYTLKGLVKPITDCVGDTHILKPVSTELDDFEMDKLVVRFDGDSDKRYAYNTGWYVNGVLQPEGQNAPKGGIEKLIDGEWVWQKDILTVRAYMHTLAAPPFDTVAAGESISFYFPHNEPGTYRITFTLREAIVYGAYTILDDPPPFETGEEVYVISHTYTVPKPTYKHFDLLGISAYTYRPDDEHSYLAHVSMLIRNNDGYQFYQDLSIGKLEKMVDGEWVDVSSVQEKFLEIPYYDWCEEGRVMLADISVNQFRRYLYVDDLSADYRLTLDFVESEDGSGERYTLQFRMNFSEEK